MTDQHPAPTAGDMQQLVERLREAAVYSYGNAVDADLLEGAADAIERLSRSPMAKYPDDGGLGPQQRELGESFDGFKMLRDHFGAPISDETDNRRAPMAEGLVETCLEIFKRGWKCGQFAKGRKKPGDVLDFWFSDEQADLRAAIAALNPAILGAVEAERDGFAPCPTCKQYSHSLGNDALADAFIHFQSMFSHRGDGIPTQHNFDERTRDAAQVLMAAIRSPDVGGGG